VKRRWLHQLWTYGAAIRRAREDLMALRERPVAAPAAPLLLHAYDHIPFWRERMRHAGLTRHDLARPDALLALPPLSRAEVQARGPDMTDRSATPSVQDDFYTGTTSGSTGEPLRYVQDGLGFLWFWAFVDFALAYAGRAAPPLRPLESGVHLLCALGHSPGYEDLVPLLHGTRFRKWNVGEAGFATGIARAAPAVCTGDPDSLAALLGTRARPRLILSSAFAMPPDLRARLEAETGAVVLEYYSAAEMGPIGVACRAGRGYHVLTPAVVVEEAAIEGAGVGAGAGAGAGGEAGATGALSELLVTNLRNVHFPLVRYRVGDLGRVEADDGCACGLRSPRVTGLSGRTRALFRARGGRPFDPAAVNPVLARISGLLEARVTERAAGRYELLYRAASPLAEADSSLLRSRLAHLFGGEATLSCERREAPLRLPGEKPRPFVAMEATV